MQFIRSAINDHKNSDLYRDADIANKYATGHNVEAEHREKVYIDLMGVTRRNNAVPCHRLKTNLFKILAVQRNSFLLGNGVTLSSEQKKKALGDDFDNVVYNAGYAAVIKTVSYLYWNNDHLESFDNLNFVPLFDETNAALRAGVRWWQIAPNKPLRATLYEEDGYTEYAWGINEDGTVAKDNEGRVIVEKRPYKLITQQTPSGEMEIIDFENYPSFPIVPLWANRDKTSPFECIHDIIDAMDENANSVNDDLTESQIYWLFQNADGSDVEQLGQVLRQIRDNHVVAPGYNQTVEPHTIQVPVAERQTEYARLRAQAYENFQGFDVDAIKSGNVVNAQIEAAYEPLNHAADEFEFCVLDCFNRLFKLIPNMGNEKATFTRSMMSNRSETIQNANAAATITGADYAREKIMTAFGDIDRINEVTKQMQAEEQEMTSAYLNKLNELAKSQKDTSDQKPEDNIEE